MNLMVGLAQMYIFGILVTAVVLPHFPQISIKGVGRQLAYMRRGRQDGAVHEVDAPAPRKEVSLLPWMEVID
jgi:hypothetical protein